MWRTAYNYLCHARARRTRGWRPLLAAYYLTYACDFRCPYCSDGAGRPYYRKRSPILGSGDALALLANVRRHCDHVVLTGGEPAKHPEFGRIVEGVGALGFDGVILTTNGYDIAPHLDAIASSVHHLIFSLDTLDRTRGDRWYGTPGALDRVVDTIERASRVGRRRYEIAINSVATPENIEDIYEVYRFARARGFQYAVSPELKGVKASPELRASPAWRRLIDFLIAEKARGERVAGTRRYLEYLRDFRKFRCRPSTLLAVSPAGEVLYPCLEIGEPAGNLLADPDLDGIRARALRRLGPEPSCDNRCHSPCALGFSLALDLPFVVLDEAFRTAHGWLLRRVGS